MKTRTIIQEIAARLIARRNCITSGNDEWLSRHTAVLMELQEELPSGSGIDCGTKIDLDCDNGSKVVLTLSYHHMNDSGMYDGWTEHTITVTPAFDGIDLRISGRDRNGIKEYLHEVYQIALNESCPARVFEADKATA